MMKTMFFALSSAALVATAHAQEKPADSATTKPLRAEYTIYSGELGDERAPTRDERKLSIDIKGPAAKEIFDSLYPDAKGVSCSSEQGERLRRKGHVWCAYSPSRGYRCFIGFNLRNGESIAGGSC